MHWDVIIHHCPGGTPDCHPHTIESFNGVSEDEFTAPDHEWYSYLEFKLTVTDSGNLTDQESVFIDPQVVTLSYNSVPSGLSINVGDVAENAPFTRPAIIGSLNTITAPPIQTLGTDQYFWVSWSDGGSQSHEVLAGENPATYTANYSLCLSSDESCNGIDEDCNGTKDEDYIPNATSCGIGACASTGLTSCVNGIVQDGCAPGNPAPNDITCNGIDDNCNGTNDENYISVGTSCGVGACADTGATSCVNGSVQNSCIPGNPAPNDITCNGIDDNCNGTNDENYLSVGTSCGVGACADTGATSCVNGDIQDSCTPGNPAPNDASCNGIDDNCNGTNDENYLSVGTSCGVGACADTGATSCVNGDIQNSCTPGNPAPSDASCNGIDDNCNGSNDENYIPVGTSCGIGVCANTGVTACVNGGVLDNCTPGNPAPNDTTCNGIDDDCNGTNDEDYLPVVTNCGIGACAASGLTACINGGVQDGCSPGAPAPNDSVCNSIDDDCDGPIDEEVPPVTVAPSSQTFSVFGGSGTIEVIVPPGACNWTAISQETWITIVSGGSGNSDGTIQFDVAPNASGSQRNGNIIVNSQTFVVTQDSSQTPVIFLDDFEDNDVSNWNQIKPAWTAVSGKLNGSTNKMAYLTSPDFGKCSVCVFETDITLENAATRASLLAWHQDKKNLVELTLLADKNKIDLRHKVAGKTVQRKKMKKTLELNRSYHLRVVYDGTKVRAYLDQALILEFNASVIPNGNAGYRIKTVNGPASSKAGQLLIY